MTSSETTPADIRAVTSNNGDGMGFGGNGAWWLIVLFLFAFTGWGGRGGYGMTGGGAADNYVLASDFATLQRQIDSGFAGVERRTDAIVNGICDSSYANAQLNAATNLNIANGFANAELSRANQQSAIMQQLFAIQSNADHCCCENKAAIADLKYTVAMGDNATGNAISTAARDIIDSQNANYRALHDEIVANRIEDKNAQISALQQQLFAQQLAASQAAQNNFLVDKLGTKCPIPAYLTCNPNAPLNYSVNYGTGCGCAA